MRLVFAMALGITMLISCVQKKKEPVQPIDTSSLMHQVKVEEVIQGTSYTYLRVSESGDEYWVAVGKKDARVGDNFYYEKGLEMKDFKSKELDRVFEQILFINNLSSTPVVSGEKKNLTTHSGKKTIEQKDDIDIGPVDGGVSIAELFGNRQNYDNKKVLVSGKVVKVNKNIMSRNWVHIQDGSADDGNYDLTITTEELVDVGNVVTFEGTVSLDKDFGAGYFYELIVEGAELK